jgi:hypothetical protein
VGCIRYGPGDCRRDLRSLFRYVSASNLHSRLFSWRLGRSEKHGRGHAGRAMGLAWQPGGALARIPGPATGAGTNLRKCDCLRQSDTASRAGHSPPLAPSAASPGRASCRRTAPAVVGHFRHANRADRIGHLRVLAGHPSTYPGLAMIFSVIRAKLRDLAFGERSLASPSRGCGRAAALRDVQH